MALQIRTSPSAQDYEATGSQVKTRLKTVSVIRTWLILDLNYCSGLPRGQISGHDSREMSLKAFSVGGLPTRKGWRDLGGHINSRVSTTSKTILSLLKGQPEDSLVLFPAIFRI